MADDETILGRAIAKVEDAALRATLEKEVALLRGSRRFGLVFDRHLPESVRLVDHPMRPGVKVALRDESSAETWRVDGFTDRTRASVVLDDGTTRPVAELVVIREFGEPIHPGLRSLERVQRGEVDDPWHTVINGENFHALQLLRETHRGEVDLIYIDPPYNTGNEGWIYNDKYVADKDGSKSSKWLSFMERRLLIARDLLKPTGVIIVAIGDDEHHRLRMLMDQVFGATNFISDVVWQGGRKNDSRYVSNGADYMLIYAKDESAMAALEIRWRDEKVGVDEVLAAAAAAWAASHGDEARAEARMRAWFRSQPRDAAVQSLSRFVYFLPDGTLCSDTDLRSPSPRPNLQFELRNPITGAMAVRNENGWRYERATLERLNSEGYIIWRADPAVPPRLKRPLQEASGQVATSVFDRPRVKAGRWLESVIGDKRFPFPKDHEVLMRWIRLAAPKDALILDFFVGSGSTTEAVLRLNAEDGGTRRSIAVTNNEVGATEAKKLHKEGHHPGDPEWEAKGVFEFVTHPRVSTVVTGVRPDGSTYSDGLRANVEFLKLEYLDSGAVRRGKEFARIAPLLWLEMGGQGERIDDDPGTGFALTATYGVLFDIDRAAAFIEAAEQVEGLRRAYVVTDSQAELQAVGQRLPSSIDVVALYDDYLRRFEGNRDS